MSLCSDSPPTFAFSLKPTKKDAGSHGGRAIIWAPLAATRFPEFSGYAVFLNDQLAQNEDSLAFRRSAGVLLVPWVALANSLPVPLLEVANWLYPRLRPYGCGCPNRFGVPFWLVGEFTTHFRAYFSGWIGMFTGGTIGFLSSWPIFWQDCDRWSSFG